MQALPRRLQFKTVGFPHSDISGSKATNRLPEAFRRLVASFIAVLGQGIHRALLCLPYGDLNITLSIHTSPQHVLLRVFHESSPKRRFTFCIFAHTLTLPLCLRCSEKSLSQNRIESRTLEWQSRDWHKNNDGKLIVWVPYVKEIRVSRNERTA